MKTCNCCGQTFKAIPSDAKPWVWDGSLVGWSWNCKCGSTMFVKAVGEGQ